MTLCRNFTNKLLLQPIIYPGSDRVTYFVAQDEVNNALSNGVPEVILPQIEHPENAPKIAVLLTRDKHPDREKPDYSMPVSIVEAIILSGGQPCFMIYEKIEDQLNIIKPDGIFLPGGDFALPETWLEGKPAHAENPLRAEAYLACLNYAQKHKLPLLGVCAGEQMLAGFCGCKITKVENHRGIVKEFAHNMNIIKDCLLHKITGLNQVQVNSNHSEAVSLKNLGDVIVSATSDDNVVEAIEPKNPWNPFVIGIQSHPEYFVKTGDVFAVRLFRSFIEACINV